MGAAKRKLSENERFLRDHRQCCYCGGKATTIDEMPPRILFKEKKWPDGFRFPACAQCNHGRSLTDSVIAFNLRCGELRDEYIEIDRFNRLARTLLRTDRDLVPSPLNRSAAERRFSELIGFPNLVLPSPSLADLNPKIIAHFQIFLLRLTQALYYRDEQRIFPQDHLVHIVMRPNSTYLGAQKMNEVIDHMFKMLPRINLPNWSNKPISPQFFYASGNIQSESAYCMFAQFGTSMNALCVAGPENFFYRNNLAPTTKSDGTILSS